jgi:N-acetylglutamate synthase-like GNAT family acetyltransferase
MTNSYNLSLLCIDQIDQASEMLARAFQEEPLFIYFYPDPLYRKEKSIFMLKNLIISGLVSGEVYITSDKCEGVAVWNPFGEFKKKSRTQSRELIKMLRGVRKEIYSDPELVERNSRLSEVNTELHYKYANSPHWFLSTIGVDPIFQGKGFASRLIRMKLEEAKNQNLPCYLNTENIKNVPLYEHFDFKLAEQKPVPNSDITVYSMIKK